MERLSQKDADALVRVLSLAENSSIWSEPVVGEEMKQWRDETYAAIQTVRQFLKERGVLTLAELAKQLSAKRVPWTILPDGEKRGMTMEHLGFIPSFLNELDERPAREQFAEEYAHGGGWRKTSPQWKMDPVSHAITYGEADEEGPAEHYRPLAEAKLRDERIFFYDSSWVSIVQPDGSFEISRMD